MSLDSLDISLAVLGWHEGDHGFVTVLAVEGELSTDVGVRAGVGQLDLPRADDALAVRGGPRREAQAEQQQGGAGGRHPGWASWCLKGGLGVIRLMIAGGRHLGWASWVSARRIWGYQQEEDDSTDWLILQGCLCKGPVINNVRHSRTIQPDM